MRCSFRDCFNDEDSNDSPGITFHRVVCSKHFLEDDLYQTKNGIWKYTIDAVPDRDTMSECSSLSDWDNNEEEIELTNVSHTPEPVDDEIAESSTSICAITHSDETLNTHSNIERTEHAVANVQIGHEITNNEETAVASPAFSEVEHLFPEFTSVNESVAHFIEMEEETLNTDLNIEETQHVVADIQISHEMTNDEETATARPTSSEVEPLDAYVTPVNNSEAYFIEMQEETLNTDLNIEKTQQVLADIQISHEMTNDEKTATARPTSSDVQPLYPYFTSINDTEAYFIVMQEATLNPFLNIENTQHVVADIQISHEMTNDEATATAIPTFFEVEPLYTYVMPVYNSEAYGIVNQETLNIYSNIERTEHYANIQSVHEMTNNEETATAAFSEVEPVHPEVMPFNNSEAYVVELSTNSDDEDTATARQTSSEVEPVHPEVMSVNNSEANVIELSTNSDDEDTATARQTSSVVEPVHPEVMSVNNSEAYVLELSTNSDDEDTATARQTFSVVESLCSEVLSVDDSEAHTIELLTESDVEDTSTIRTTPSVVGSLCSEIMSVNDSEAYSFVILSDTDVKVEPDIEVITVDDSEAQEKQEETPKSPNSIQIKKKLPERTVDGSPEMVFTKPRPFCNFCNYGCKFKNVMLTHMVSDHLHEPKFVCEQCDSKLHNTANLCEHMTTHDDKLIECQRCVRYKTSIRNHKISHTREKLLKFELSKIKYLRQMNLLKHMRKHHICTMCHKKCTNAHNVPRTTPCTCHCGFQCTHKIKEEEDEVIFIPNTPEPVDDEIAGCSTSNAEIRQPDGYVIIEQGKATKTLGPTDSVDRQPEPNDSTIKTSSKHTMRLDFCDNTIKKFACPQCDSKYTRNIYLTEHMRTHTGEKPYACNTCDYRSRNKTNLNYHMQSHSDDKPFACKLCNVKYKQKSNLMRHMMLHSGQRPFSCHHCDSKFKQKANVVAHMRTHSGSKPYICDICKKSFTEKRNLDTHVESHVTKPFACHICTYRTKTNVNLIRHIRIHTTEKKRLLKIAQSNVKKRQA